jgi:hypothetical protein
LGRVGGEVDVRREAMREETTNAAEEESPDPVGTLPSMRIFILGIGGFLTYVR